MQQFGKQDSFSVQLVSESSGTQFSRTTNGIQSGPDFLEESRLTMTFLFNMGVTGRSCSIRLEGKAGNEIFKSSRLEFLKRFSAKTTHHDH